ncbi:hypothetical protein [Streptomyces sp. ADI96-02]|uniref:hypothetical protein n=1 Tax=Streptomyces sp. ADI96-02 TaxID=1522760 RepID=UPI001F14AC76|nr:hypothetical protein [Streptomyces sp. ADI96-02]
MATMDAGQGTARRRVSRTAAALRGMVLGGLTGAVIAGFVVAVILEDFYILGTTGAVVLFVILAIIAEDRLRSSRRTPPVTRTALARIEDLRATNGELADVPVSFDLTVAPDDRPAYRVRTSQQINLVDLPDYRPQGIVVVRYRPDEPWEVAVVVRPSEEWRRRAAMGKIDSAPDSSRVSDPERLGGFCVVSLVFLLAGAAAVVFLFRGPLFAETDDGTPPQQGSTSSSSSTTRTFSTSTTVSGPSTSMLVLGRMRETAAKLAERAEASNVSELTIEAHRMAIRGDTGRSPAETFHVQMLPYELFPGLIREAQTGLGVRNPRSWRIEVTPAGNGAPKIKVSVTGKEGTAHLEADATARVTGRDPIG